MKNVGGNTSVLRQINTTLILDAMRSRRSASYSELANATGLSLATCVNIIADLVEQGDVVELEEKRSRGGRPAKRFSFNPNNNLFCLLVLKNASAGETIDYAIVNSSGDAVDTGSAKYAKITPEVVCDLVGEKLAMHDKIAVIGLSVPSIVANGRVELTDLPGIYGTHLAEIVSVKFSLPAVIDNDMNLAAIGCYNKNRDKNWCGLAYLLAPRDFGVGAGLIANGMIIRGKSNFAGEMIHIPFEGKTDNQCRLLSKPERRPIILAKMLIALTATINPDMVILSGDETSQELIDEIRELVLQHVGPEHAPTIRFEPNYEKDCFLGLTNLAQEAISCQVRMVEKESVQGMTATSFI